MATFGFRKSIKIAPGVRVNVTHRGVRSVSAGAGGLRVTQRIGAPARPAASASATSEPAHVPTAPSLAERAAALQERLGAQEVARRRRINSQVLAWFAAAITLLFTVAVPPLLLISGPLLVLAVVVTVKARRHRA